MLAGPAPTAGTPTPRPPCRAADAAAGREAQTAEIVLALRQGHGQASAWLEHLQVRMTLARLCSRDALADPPPPQPRRPAPARLPGPRVVKARPTTSERAPRGRSRRRGGAESSAARGGGDLETARRPRRARRPRLTSGPSSSRRGAKAATLDFRHPSTIARTAARHPTNETFDCFTDRIRRCLLPGTPTCSYQTARRHTTTL